MNKDTICALSTAGGSGAIALIRISGPDSLSIGDQIFSKKLSDKSSHTVHFGLIRNTKGEMLDEVLITVLKNGKSFTGEDTLEIACHGSSYIQQEILKLLLTKGCRMAEPGEFTMRAFLNGKMDLSQAEAVADLIASESQRAHELALTQMRGKFSNELKVLREKLIHFASLVELELDFAEEDVEFADRSQLRNLIDEVSTYIQQLISSFELGNAIKNGVPVALVGAPNTGKSTLLNQLLGEERAIVSAIAGTTRDSIEETLNIDGILFRLIDTAGIRDEAEEIEAIGIERSYQKIASARIVLVLTDINAPLTELERVNSWISDLQLQFPNKKIALLYNKTDQFKASPLPQTSSDTLRISAKQGVGIQELKQWLFKQVFDEKTQQSTVVSNARHLEALQLALSALNRAQTGLETQITGDFIAMDIREAMYHLGSITGAISTEDLLGNIFSKFCIGK